MLCRVNHAGRAIPATCLPAAHPWEEQGQGTRCSPSSSPTSTGHRGLCLKASAPQVWFDPAPRVDASPGLHTWLPLNTRLCFQLAQQDRRSRVTLKGEGSRAQGWRPGGVPWKASGRPLTEVLQVTWLLEWGVGRGGVRFGQLSSVASRCRWPPGVLGA